MLKTLLGQVKEFRLLSILSSAACVILLFVFAVPESVQDSVIRWLRS